MKLVSSWVLTSLAVGMNRLQQQHHHNREGMVFDRDHQPIHAGPDLISGSPRFGARSGHPRVAPAVHPAAMGVSKHPAVRGRNGSHPRAAHLESYIFASRN